MNGTQRNLLKILSELEEGKWGNINDISNNIGISRTELERQLNLLQDDKLLEWTRRTVTRFSFRITADGYRFLEETSED